MLQSTAHLGALCALRSTALLRAARNTFRPGGSNGFLLLQILCSLSTSTEFPLPFALQILLVKQSLCEFYQTIPAYFVVFFLPGPCYEAVAKGKFFLLMHQIDRTHECWKLFTLPSKWPELWRSEIPPRSLPGFDSWVGKIPWWRKWQPSPLFLPGEFHGQRSLLLLLLLSRFSHV